jgi:hypothetical protein
MGVRFQKHEGNACSHIGHNSVMKQSAQIVFIFFLRWKTCPKICTNKNQVIMHPIKLTENRLFCLKIYATFSVCFSRVGFQKLENEGTI